MFGLIRRLNIALAAVGLVLRTSSTADPTTDPSISAGSAAPSSAEPNGSCYHRTNGRSYRRVGGAWKNEPVVLYANTAASTAITNQTGEQTFSLSYTLAADFLEAGASIRIRVQGIAPNTNSTDTLTIKVKIGSTILVQTSAVNVSDNDIWYADFTLTCRTAGASGTFVGSGHYQDPGAAGSTLKSAYKASTTIDTTATQAITVSAEWSVANSGNSCRLDHLLIEAL